MMKKSTPQEIYEEALKEQASPNPIKKRDACKKGWLATTEAVDAFLAVHIKFVRRIRQMHTATGGNSYPNLLKSIRM